MPPATILERDITTGTLAPDAAMVRGFPAGAGGGVVGRIGDAVSTVFAGSGFGAGACTAVFCSTDAAGFVDAVSVFALRAGRDGGAIALTVWLGFVTSTRASLPDDCGFTSTGGETDLLATFTDESGRGMITGALVESESVDDFPVGVDVRTSPAAAVGIMISSGTKLPSFDRP